MHLLLKVVPRQIIEEPKIFLPSGEKELILYVQLTTDELEHICTCNFLFLQTIFDVLHYEIYNMSLLECLF